MDVQVVMVGIHSTIRVDEVVKRMDSVVTGEAESIWPTGLRMKRKMSSWARV